jgi:hypothetical protein
MPRKARAKKKKRPEIIERLVTRRDRIFLAAIVAAVAGNIIARRQWSEALRRAPIEVVKHLSSRMDEQAAENAVWLFITQTTMILTGRC